MLVPVQQLLGRCAAFFLELCIIAQNMWVEELTHTRPILQPFFLAVSKPATDALVPLPPSLAAHVQFQRATRFDSKMRLQSLSAPRFLWRRSCCSPRHDPIRGTGPCSFPQHFLFKHNLVEMVAFQLLCCPFLAICFQHLENLAPHDMKEPQRPLS